MIGSQTQTAAEYRLMGMDLNGNHALLVLGDNPQECRALYRRNYSETERKYFLTEWIERWHHSQQWVQLKK